MTRTNNCSVNQLHKCAVLEGLLRRGHDVRTPHRGVPAYPHRVERA
jgi:hypothetical protein